ncbi:MAG: pilus assembly protein [Betaproteobacteria bacterium]|nr:pilus assembly protein [Betaproteobacteria bacterium]MDE2055925.1 pilus assembly protein [Betaproteobacteria bacterium]
MANSSLEKGGVIIEFALIFPIFLLIIFFYLDILFVLWNSSISQWFLWRATRLESTQILSSQQLLDTLTTTGLGQSILFNTTLLNSNNLHINFINALGDTVSLPANFSANNNQVNCQLHNTSCINSVMLQLCQGSVPSCQNLNAPFSLYGLNTSFNLTINQLTLIRPLEAAGGFY